MHLAVELEDGVASEDDQTTVVRVVTAAAVVDSLPARSPSTALLRGPRRGRRAPAPDDVLRLRPGEEERDVGCRQPALPGLGRCDDVVLVDRRDAHQWLHARGNEGAATGGGGGGEEQRRVGGRHTRKPSPAAGRPSADDLVDEAPPPRLARLDAPHDRVAGLLEVGRGVAALGRVAAPTFPQAAQARRCTQRIP